MRGTYKEVKASGKRTGKGCPWPPGVTATVCKEGEGFWDPRLPKLPSVTPRMPASSAYRLPKPEPPARAGN